MVRYWWTLDTDMGRQESVTTDEAFKQIMKGGHLAQYIIDWEYF